MVLEISRDQANRRRLARHHLLEPAPKARLAEVASDICGVQAQVLSSAALALRARVRGLRMADVEEALRGRRTLVKTWAMRGTLHLLASSDLPRHVAAMTWVASSLGRDAFARRGLDPRSVEAITDAIRRALDGRALTREELADAVGRDLSIDAETRKLLRSPWGELLQPAAFAGALCFGPSRGAQVTFVRPDRWLGGWKEVPGEAAFRALIRRFVHTYGPVTPDDLAHWWGFLPGENRRKAWRLVEDELEEVRFEDRQAWVLKDDVEGMRRDLEGTRVRLLPSWDGYVMLSSPRDAFVEERFRQRIFSPIRGNRPVLLVDGVAAGVWERQPRGDTAEIQVQPFHPLAPDVARSVRDEADDVGRFLGAKRTRLALTATER